MVFILGTGLEVFGVDLLWVSRCSDVSRGCKITAAGVRGAGAVSPSGLQLCNAGSFAPGEDGSCGAGTAAARSWEERTLDECFSCTGMTWMFLELLEVKQVYASWGCIPFAGCVRKELDLLYYRMLAGKTVFCCV